MLKLGKFLFQFSYRCKPTNSEIFCVISIKRNRELTNTEDTCMFIYCKWRNETKLNAFNLNLLIVKSVFWGRMCILTYIVSKKNIGIMFDCTMMNLKFNVLVFDLCFINWITEEFINNWAIQYTNSMFIIYKYMLSCLEMIHVMMYILWKRK